MCFYDVTARLKALSGGKGLSSGQEDRRKVRKRDPHEDDQPGPTGVPEYIPTPREGPVDVPAYKPTPRDRPVDEPILREKLVDDLGYDTTTGEWPAEV